MSTASNAVKKIRATASFSNKKLQSNAQRNYYADSEYQSMNKKSELSMGNSVTSYSKNYSQSIQNENRCTPVLQKMATEQDLN